MKNYLFDDGKLVGCKNTEFVEVNLSTTLEVADGGLVTIVVVYWFSERTKG